MSAADSREERDVVQEAYAVLVDRLPARYESELLGIAQALANAGLLQVAADSSKAGSNVDLDALAELEQGATPGPWGVRHNTKGFQYEFSLDCPLCGVRFHVASDITAMVERAADVLQQIHTQQHELLATVERVRDLTRSTDGDDLDPNFDGNTVADIQRALDGA